MRLSTGRIKLNSAMKTLALRWDETKAGWKDPVSRDLDEQFFEPLSQQVGATLRAIDRLAQVIDRAYQELDAERSGL